MLVLGLDLSTKTGLTILDSNSRVVVAAEISVAKNGDNLDRAISLVGEIESIIDSVGEVLSIVVVEGYGYSNTNTLVTLAEIGTVVRVFLKLRKLKYIDVPPTTLKKFITGSGNAKKENIILEVYKRWGFEAETNNIADSYGLAILGLSVLGVDVGLPEKNLDALKVLSNQL